MCRQSSVTESTGFDVHFINTGERMQGNPDLVSIKLKTTHSDHKGNEQFNLLARQGSSLHNPWAVFLRKRLETSERWRCSNIKGKCILDEFELKLTKNLINKGRK